MKLTMQQADEIRELVAKGRLGGSLRITENYRKEAELARMETS